MIWNSFWEHSAWATNKIASLAYKSEVLKFGIHQFSSALAPGSRLFPIGLQPRNEKIPLLLCPWCPTSAMFSHQWLKSSVCITHTSLCLFYQCQKLHIPVLPNLLFYIWSDQRCPVVSQNKWGPKGPIWLTSILHKARGFNYIVVSITRHSQVLRPTTVVKPSNQFQIHQVFQVWEGMWGIEELPQR